MAYRRRFDDMDIVMNMDIDISGDGTHPASADGRRIRLARSHGRNLVAFSDERVDLHSPGCSSAAKVMVRRTLLIEGVKG